MAPLRNAELLGSFVFRVDYRCSFRVSSIDDNVTHNSQSISTARD